MKSRIEREIVTIRHMIRIYCRHHHHTKNNLCDDCNELLEYAKDRVEKCVFGENKPVCSECKVHCYKKDLREKVRQVMRFAGPKMLFRHPVLAIMHLVDKRKFKVQLRKYSRTPARTERPPDRNHSCRVRSGG